MEDFQYSEIKGELHYFLGKTKSRASKADKKSNWVKTKTKDVDFTKITNGFRLIKLVAIW